MSSARMSANFPIFIVGLPRSGSTLWSRIIGSHPDLAQFTEVHFLSVWHRDFRYFLKHQIGDLSQDKNVAKLVESLFSKNHIINPKNTIWFWNQIRSLEKDGLKEALYKRVIASEDRDIGTLFRFLIEEATRCQGQSRAVVKFPVYPTYLGRLIEWWPEGRIVHISRDPRALAVSKTNDPGGVARLTTRHPWTRLFLPFAYKYFAVFQYIWASHAHARYEGLPNYRLFLYEDLVSNPRKIVQELCDFCELDFDESMLNPPAGQASSITGRTTCGFDPSRAVGWKKSLKPFESKLIEYITRSSMRRFHYKP
jgi:hypothetical protein